MKKFSTAEFVAKAIVVHKNKYDYSKVVYANARTKVKIVCPRHGEFNQLPQSHIKGSGCSECAQVKKLTTKSFIERARLKHGDKYNYSKCEYTRSKGLVTIICPEHGEFRKRADQHLDGSGCIVCANKRSTSNEFIKRAKLIHGSKYDYADVEYITARVKVKLGCPDHGDFYQTPWGHLNGNGCPSCATYGFNLVKPAELYFLKFEKPFASFWKVGITNRTARDRFCGDFAFVTSQYYWQCDSGSDAQELERLVLKKFNKYRFDNSFLFSLLYLGGDTECFDVSLPHEKVISFVEQQIKVIHKS